jgi:solute carrier family 35 protein C2
MAPSRALLLSLMYIFLWYGCSMGMTFFNKWLFETYDFHFPLAVTVIHMLTIFVLCSIARSARYHFFGIDRPSLSTADLFRKVFPMAVVSALDIGLSNLGLMMIDVTLYTMCKSTVLAFTLIFACAFRLERLVRYLTDSTGTNIHSR